MSEEATMQHDDTTKERDIEAMERSLAYSSMQYERERRDHLRKEARQRLASAHLNRADRVVITKDGITTITATFPAPPSATIPALDTIAVSVSFPFATCDQAIEALDAVLGTITTALDDARCANAELAGLPAREGQ